MEYLKVLVVDDEFGIRSGVKRILDKFKVDYPFMDEDIAFDVMEAATGEEALDVIKVNVPEVVLLDNKLPGIHGVDLLEKINKNYPEILVVMITSYASLELAVKATTFGAYDFVPKPFTPQELKASMENVTKHYFLRKMTKKLNKEGKQIRFQFLTVLSHELKTPLNAVEGYLKMMKEKQAGDSISDYEEIINRSLSRISAMRNLIMDMLDFTKLDSNKKSRELNEIDIVPIAQTAVDTMMPYAIQKDIKIKLDCAERILMQADPEEIEIIFNNLISNAIKYNKNEGSVKCEIKESGTYIEIIVEDTGIGIEQEQISKVFEEFVRIKNDKTKNISGSGLGLSIVKNITNLYNGDINLISTPDKGSIFIVKLQK
ncbi:MAG: hybrid sensor histidine kinase/response regulator [Bacteroidales bacterium]|nr:hybrid sensor histidine kinase/response regulator [Bacteroidales bacterium]